LRRAGRTRRCGRAVAFLLGLGLAAPGQAAPPAQDYVLQCRGCHRPDGRGAPGAVPSLVGTMGRFLAVPGGRAYLVQVPGTAQAPLDDAAVAALLNWMLATFDPVGAAGHAPYSAKEVARHRAEPLLDVEGRRRALLRELERRGEE